VKIVPDRPYYCDQLAIDDPDGVIRGIFVGGCVHERNSWSIWEGARSHAHNYRRNEWFGWICILRPDEVLTQTGEMTATLAHGIAHLLCPDQYHSAKWKRTISKMGYPSEILKSGLKPLRDGN